MSLRLYNTIAAEKQAFVPLRPGRAGIYVCGPTVYDHAHIGHARSAVVFDVLVRYLKFQGMHVTYVRNLTDIDDKIIERCERIGVHPEEFTETYISSYREDMKALNVQSPNFEPRVTEYVDLIQTMISGLIEKKHAYISEDSVLFRVGTQYDYGLLSGIPAWGNKTAGSRLHHKMSKECDRDFVLWKKTHGNEYGWESPWGKGRPGWHIECVAMSQALLGKLFDIHGGGSDLIFPHHENERSISRSLAESDLARYWIHHGLVTATGEKLSKSENFPVRIQDTCQRYHPEAVRLFLLSTHYRRPLDFSDNRLSMAVSALDRLYGFLSRCKGISRWVGRNDFIDDSFQAQFCQVVDEDFNIPEGISKLFLCVRQMNRRMDDVGGFDSLSDRDKVRIGELVLICRNVLGIFGDLPEQYIKKRAEIFTCACPSFFPGEDSNFLQDLKSRLSFRLPR